MTTATTLSPTQQRLELLGQTVVLIGGRSGIGLATARRARVDGAKVILTGRDPDRLQRAALAVHIMFNTALTGCTYDIDGGEQLLTGTAS